MIPLQIPTNVLAARTPDTNVMVVGGSNTNLMVSSRGATELR